MMISSSDEIRKHSLMLRFAAHIVSVIFHPLFISLYAAYYLLFIHPAFFIGLNTEARYWILIRILINMVVFPGIAVLLLKGVGFISSVTLENRKDRIIPYITSGIFFFWTFLVFKNQNIISPIMVSFIFSVFLSSSVAMIMNIYSKVSMHAVALGGFIGLLLIIMQYLHSSQAIPLPMMIVILITGVVCSARMIVSDHTPRQIYSGLLAGIICQIAGAYFILS